MPLKIRVKPEAKVYAGGAVLKNVGKKPADLLILTDGPVLRENFMMNPDDQNSSDTASVYFLIQMLYLFKGQGAPIDNLVKETLKSFAKLYPTLSEKVDDIVVHLEAGESFKALRIRHGLLNVDAKHVAAADLVAVTGVAGINIEEEVAV